MATGATGAQTTASESRPSVSSPRRSAYFVVAPLPYMNRGRQRRTQPVRRPQRLWRRKLHRLLDHDPSRDPPPNLLRSVCPLIVKLALRLGVKGLRFAPMNFAR